MRVDFIKQPGLRAARRSGFLLRAAFLGVWLLVASASAFRSGWPEGYSLREGSASPDGRFGVLIPSLDAAGDGEEESIKDFLADLKSRRPLAAIRGAHYFSGENHHDLGVSWGRDSSWCAVTYEGRYGFENITLLSQPGGRCEQIDLGGHIQKALDSAIARQTGNPESTCYAGARFRSGDGGSVLVRATGLTNPKGFSDQIQRFAAFLGTFDPVRGVWVRSESLKIDSLDDIECAFSDGLGEEITFASAADRLAWNDDRLNEVYRALRVLLPPPRFAALKKEQIAWLKKLGAADTTDAKVLLLESRIRELRGLAWEDRPYQQPER